VADFHGNIEVPPANNGGTIVVADPANLAGTALRTGGAAFSATMIRQLKTQQPYSILAGAGDLIGASPVTSVLTHDEATVDILNQFGLEVTSVGNHEFDRGKTELKRIQNGGCYPGGVRADLIYRNGGNVTFGDLLTVAPFGNTLVTVDLIGSQVLRLLEQQWESANCSAKQGANGCARLLQPSRAFAYTWNAAMPSGAADGKGHRVEPGAIKINGDPVDLARTYRVTVNNFMAPGPGDDFPVVGQGANITSSGVIDIDAFVAYMKSRSNPAPPLPRIQRMN